MAAFSRAAGYYSAVCEANPYNYVGWYKLAFVYGKMGKLDSAERIYRHINRNLFPHFAKTDTNLGTIYMRRKQFEEALRYYAWAEWLNPYDVDVLNSTASIYIIHRRDHASAKRYLRRVLTIDPQNGYAVRVLKKLETEPGM